MGELGRCGWRGELRIYLIERSDIYFFFLGRFVVIGSVAKRFEKGKVGGRKMVAIGQMRNNKVQD